MNLSDKLNTALFGTVVGLAGIVNFLDMIHSFKQDFLPPLSSYVGNANESFAYPGAVCIIAEILCKEVPRLKAITKYAPAVTYVSMAVYNVLGETVLEVIPNNTIDPKDIPAALISCLAGYLLFKRVQKKSHYSTRSLLT